MDRTQELDQAVGLLTRPSKHRIETEDGSAVWVTSDPLLLQLALGIKSSSMGAAFKSSSGNPLPLDAGAYDLMEEIDTITWECWWKTHGLHHGHGKETLVSRLRTWAAVVRAHPLLLDEAAKITTRWVAAIEATFLPRRTREVHAHCPFCLVSKVATVDDEGNTVRRPALTLIYDREGREIDGAVCAACNHNWGRGEVASLARFVASLPESEEDDAA
jgi:hypothetical protein